MCNCADAIGNFDDLYFVAPQYGYFTLGEQQTTEWFTIPEHQYYQDYSSECSMRSIIVLETAPNFQTWTENPYDLEIVFEANFADEDADT